MKTTLPSSRFLNRICRARRAASARLGYLSISLFALLLVLLFFFWPA